MDHSIGDGIIVMALSAALIAYLYFKYKEKQQRLEVIHAERLAAMDKGIPLPELPTDLPKIVKPREEDTKALLLLGIILSTFGAGAMLALLGIRDDDILWPLPLPIVMMGLGMILYYLLARERPSRDSSTNRGK